jgi:hypothetical protein
VTQRRPMVLSRLAVVAVLLAILVLPGRFVQAQAVPDPASFFVPDEALPAGFVYQPDADQLLTFDGGTSGGGSRLLRLYIRTIREDGADHITLLQVFIQTFDDEALAQAVYDGTVSGWREQGYQLGERVDLLGQPAVLGRKTFNEGAIRPTEGVVVCEHLATMNIGVQWADFADLPNEESALDIMRRLEQWVLERLAEAPEAAR